MAQGSVSPYARRSDLSGLCSVPDPFAGGVGYPAVRGYRYEGHTATGTAGKGGFNLADFGKELLTGFVAGGLSSAAFYGAGKAVEAVKGSVRSAGRGNLSNVGKPNSGQGFSPKGYTPQQGERTIDGYVKQNANPEISLYTNSAGFNNNNGNIGGQFKRFGAESGHGINGPHVHQPLRNVAPDNSVYGDVGSKTKNGGVTSPTAKDVKQLYEYIKNGKYHK